MTPTTTISRRVFNVAAAAVLAGAAFAASAQPAPVTLLNVSYDPTRELYT
ncbi:MAG TPA: sulfate transporter subunit, partial [Rhodoferax sp.]